eukprot:463598_1
MHKELNDHKSDDASIDTATKVWVISVRLAIYVLWLLTLILMILEIQEWLFSITISEMQKSQHWGPGDGTGKQYDFVAGPVYATSTIIATLPMSYIVDKKWFSREILLFTSIFMCSLCSFFIGYSIHYWQVVLLRLSFGLFQSYSE